MVKGLSASIASGGNGCRKTIKSSHALYRVAELSLFNSCMMCWTSGIELSSFCNHYAKCQVSQIAWSPLTISYSHTLGAQRFAASSPSGASGVPACGRAWTMLGSRKKPKPEKCFQTAQTPSRLLHAVLGAHMKHVI